MHKTLYQHINNDANTLRAQCPPTPLPPLRSAWLRLQLNTKIVLNHLPTQHQLRALTLFLGTKIVLI